VSRRGPIIAGAIVAVIAVVAMFFLVLPKMSEVSKTREEIDSSKTQESALRAQLASLKEAQANAPVVKAQIAKLNSEVPPTADLPALIRLLTAAADGSAVDFFTVAPGSPQLDPTGAFSTIATSISVTGGYFALDQFLFRLETLPRAAKVTSVSITPGGAAPIGSTVNSLSMQLGVEFYTTDTSAGPGSQPGPTEAGTSSVPSAFTPTSPFGPPFPSTPASPSTTSTPTSSSTPSPATSPSTPAPPGA
jgi:Tfp pilus assembly protein PilO